MNAAVLSDKKISVAAAVQKEQRLLQVQGERDNDNKNCSVKKEGAIQGRWHLSVVHFQSLSFFRSLRNSYVEGDNTEYGA